MSKKTLESQLNKLQADFKQQAKNYETAQYMLMEQIIKFVNDKDYIHLKQFCENYKRKI